MATLPAVAKVIRLDHHLHMGADANVMWRLFFQYAGSLNTADAATWAAAIATAFKSFVSATLNQAITADYIELTDLSSVSAPQVSHAASQVGGDTNTAPPAGLSMVISYQINRRYRGGKPRTYIAGVSSAYLATPNTWLTATAAGMLTNWTTYLAAVSTTPGGTAIGAITHVNVSYYSGFVNHTYPSGRVKPIPQLRLTPLVDLITTVRVNDIVASQRRRNEQP